MAKRKSKKEKCQKFLNDLTASERMLISLRDELYDGRWENMYQDLEERLNGKPYIQKLINRIKRDLECAKKIDAFEEKNNVNLTGYLMEMETTWSTTHP